MKKIKIAFCLDKKIGDSLVGFLFANQLLESQFSVSIYSDVLTAVRAWLPHQFSSFSKSPASVDDLKKLSIEYDVVVIYHYPDLAEKLSRAESIFSELQNIIYFTPWGFNQPLPTARLEQFHHITLSKMQKLNGICFAERDFRPYQYIENLCRKLHILNKHLIQPARLPEHSELVHYKNKNRILIHPTASIHKHNWAPRKFVKLAKLLKDDNFEPVFILQKHELDEWQTYLKNEFAYVALPLSELADYIYESGYAICNASGIGHLCSFLQIPTITINVNRSFAYKKWAPFFYKNTIVTHAKWMPNSLPACKTHRRSLISAKKVYKTFKRLLSVAV